GKHRAGHLHRVEIDLRGLQRPSPEGADRSSRLSRAEQTMVIGVPKEIKNNENRVSLVPAGARALAEEGHTVLVERGAGLGSGIPDERYVEAGARSGGVDEGFLAADLIVKVKERQPVEN